MKRIALALTLATLAAATLVRLPEAGEVTTPSVGGVDSELQAVFAPPGRVDTGGAIGFTLADALTVERRASLWWDYARDVADVTSRLTRKGDTTLFVPIDRAIMALPHKPHQNADGSTPDEEDARTNLESFLAAHIVPEKMDLPGGPAHTLLKGVDVTVEGEEGAYVVQPGNVKVLGVKEASNGRILYIDGIVPFQK